MDALINYMTILDRDAEEGTMMVKCPHCGAEYNIYDDEDVVECLICHETVYGVQTDIFFV